MDELQPNHRYLTIYDIQASDPNVALAELIARSEDDRLQMSKTLDDDVQTKLY